MSMEINGKTLRHNASEQYRKYRGQLLAISFSFVIVFIAALVLELVFMGSVILTFPLFVIPIFFCLQVGSIRIKSDTPMSMKEFYHPYSMGLSSKFRGCYRSLMTALKAILIFVLAALGLSVLASYLFPLLDPSYSVLMNNFADLLQSGADYATLAKFLDDNAATFDMLTNIVGTLSAFVAFLYFLVTMASNMMIVNLSLNMLTDHRLLIFVHKRTFPEIRSQYRQLFNRALWPALLLYILGFATGSAIGWVVYNSFLVIATFGMIGALLFIWPFLPVVLGVMEQIYELFSPYYFRNSTEEIKKTMDAINKNDNLTDEQREQIKDFFDGGTDLQKKIDELNAKINHQNEDKADDKKEDQDNDDAHKDDKSDKEG